MVLLPVFCSGRLRLLILWFQAVSCRVYRAGQSQPGPDPRATWSEHIDTQWNQLPSWSLTDGTHSLPVSPADLGLWVDPQATAERAYQSGAGDNAFRSCSGWPASAGWSGASGGLQCRRRPSRAASAWRRSSVPLPRNATLRFENGQWVAVPGQNGSAVDIEATLQRLAADPRGVFSSGTVPLAMQTVAPRVSDLTPVLDQLRAALDNPLRLHAYDPITDETIEWSVPRETFASWVTVQDAGDQVRFDLDSQHLAAYLQKWQAGLGAERTLETFTPSADLARVLAIWPAGDADPAPQPHPVYRRSPAKP